MTKLPDGVNVDLLKVTYYQEADSCQDGDKIQTLTVETRDAGGGKFMVIKTERWAIDKIDDLIKTLNHFRNLGK
jgi:hypothetical protein